MHRFLTFDAKIVDGSQGVGTINPPATVHNRVYAEVHNRGRVDAANVQVMALLANASAGLPPLPNSYTVDVVTGTPITTADWTTLGFVNLSTLHAGSPQIAYFDLPSTVLPLPASLPGQSHYCLVMILHSAQDPFASTQQNVDLLTLSDRKVAQKNLHIVQFVGVPPPPSEGMGMWTMLNLFGASVKDRGLIDLVIDASTFPGTISLLLPPPIFPKNPKLQAVGFRRGSTAIVKKWIRLYTPVARRLFCEAKYRAQQHKRLMEAMEKVADQAPLVLAGGHKAAVASLPISRGGARTIFLRIDPPPKSKIGSEWTFDVNQVDSATKKLLGGSRYKVVVNRKA